jgi:hypothetical protein
MYIYIYIYTHTHTHTHTHNKTHIYRNIHILHTDTHIKPPYMHIPSQYYVTTRTLRYIFIFVIIFYTLVWLLAGEHSFVLRDTTEMTFQTSTSALMLLTVSPVLLVRYRITFDCTFPTYKATSSTNIVFVRICASFLSYVLPDRRRRPWRHVQQNFSLIGRTAAVFRESIPCLFHSAEHK